MKRILLYSLTLLFLNCCLYGQDTIREISGNVIIAKVVEIDAENIRYKKVTNIDGPTYTIKTNTVRYIAYPNGEKELFTNKPPVNPNLSDEELLATLTKKSNKVFITCADGNAAIHAADAIKYWGYWQVTQEKAEADFVFKLNIRKMGAVNHACTATFEVPQTGYEFKAFKEVSSHSTRDANSKRGAVYKMIDTEIRPRFEK